MRITLENFKDVRKFSNVQGLLCSDRPMMDAMGTSAGHINYLYEKGVFKGEKGTSYTISDFQDEALKLTVLAGIGKRDKLDMDALRNAAAIIIKEADRQKMADVDIILNEIPEEYMMDSVKVLSEAAAMCLYRFEKYSSVKHETSVTAVRLISCCKDNKDYQSSIDEGVIVAEGNLIARDLVNEPSNVLTPEELGRRATALGEKYGFNTEVMGRRRIEELGMDAFLAVSRGSANEPKLIVMRYMGNPEDNKNIVGLIGKGITFDAGGYCVKGSGHMWMMKTDMGGGAAVIGAITAAARMGIKKNIVAVVAACDNLISGDAYKPGDIVRTMNGKNIEIRNTDAEGRLTLVDAVTYALRNEGVTSIIDIATLTGAVGRAIGNVVTGVVDNSDRLYSVLENASKRCDERVWRFPVFDEYKKLIKTGSGDLINSTGATGAGAITAGLFVGEFVEDKPWLHLDIAAGTFTEHPDKEYRSEGATGVGSMLLYELVKEM